MRKIAVPVLVTLACLCILFCTASAVQPKIPLDRLNSSQAHWAITMDTDANITFDGGHVINAKLGDSLPFLTVGPYDFCDNLTDGTDDHIQAQAAVDTGVPLVLLVGSIYIGDTIECNTTAQEICGVGYNGRAASYTTVYVGGNFNAFNVTTDQAVSIRNLKIQNDTGVVLTSGWGIYATQNDVYIEGIDMTNLYSGIYRGSASFTSNMRVERCTGYNLTGTCIQGYRLAGGDWTKDCTFDCNNLNNFGLLLEECEDAPVENCQFIRCEVGVKMQDCQSIKIEKSYFDQGTSSNIITTSSASLFNRHIYFYDCWFAGHSSYYPHDHTVKIDNAGETTVSMVGFYNCNFRDAYASAVSFAGTSGHNLTGVDVINCNFDNVGKSTNGACVSVVYTDGGTIMGNSYNDGTGQVTDFGFYSDATATNIIHMANRWQNANTPVGGSLGTGSISDHNIT